MDARCVSTSKIGLQHYFLDPLIGSLPANASEQQALEAESSIVRLLRGRHDSRTFEVSEISPNGAYLKHLLSAGRLDYVVPTPPS